MGYFSYKEEEAYRDGYNDGRFGRRDYFRDEHFGSDIDKAYYDGHREAEQEQKRRDEMYAEELRQEEIQQRRMDEHYRYLRDLEEQEYFNKMEAKNNEGSHYEPLDDLPF